MHRVNTTLPATVDRIEVFGNERTQLSFFDAEFHDCHGHKSPNLDELLRKVHEATQRMNSRGIFEAVDAKVILKHAEGDEFSTDLAVKVHEKSVPFLKMESYVRTGKSSSEIGAEIQGALRNPFGHGEVIKISAGKSSNGARDFLLSANIPNISRDRGDLIASVKVSEEDNSSFVSFQQKIESIGVEYISRNGHHRFECEAVVRDEVPVRVPSLPHIRNASVATTSLCGPSSKLAAKYSFTVVDTRDKKNDPSEGSLLEGFVEVACPPGSAQFLKTELQSQMHTQIGPSLWGQTGAVLSLCGSLGVIFPYGILLDTASATVNGPRGKPALSLSSSSPAFIRLSDRYHLGGPLSLRGFQLHGVGERSQQAAGMGGVLGGDALGGAGKSTFLALLSIPVPVRMLAANGVRAFAFLNLGSLGSANFWGVGGERSRSHATGATTASDGYAGVGPLFGYLRAAVGGGLVVPVASAVRLELTYAVPMVKAPSDVTKPFQIGVGLSIS